MIPDGQAGEASIIPEHDLIYRGDGERGTSHQGISDQVWCKQIVVKDRPFQGVNRTYIARYCEDSQHRTGRSGAARCRAMIRSEVPRYGNLLIRFGKGLVDSRNF